MKRVFTPPWRASACSSFLFFAASVAGIQTASAQAPYYYVDCEGWGQSIIWDGEGDYDSGDWGEAWSYMEGCITHTLGEYGEITDFYWDYYWIEPEAGWYVWDYFEDWDDDPLDTWGYRTEILCPENHSPVWGTCYEVTASVGLYRGSSAWDWYADVSVEAIEEYWNWEDAADLAEAIAVSDDPEEYWESLTEDMQDAVATFVTEWESIGDEESSLLSQWQEWSWYPELLWIHPITGDECITIEKIIWIKSTIISTITFSQLTVVVDACFNSLEELSYWDVVSRSVYTSWGWRVRTPSGASNDEDDPATYMYSVYTQRNVGACFLVACLSTSQLTINIDITYGFFRIITTF